MLNKFKIKAKKRENLNVYANLSAFRHSNKKVRNAQRERLRNSAPKSLGKKITFYLKPKNFFHYWFSRNGFIMMLKITGVGLLLFLLLVGGLFAYFRKDLNAISPGEISKRVQSTVNIYYDRNGEVIYEDKGSGNYKLVVDSQELSQNLKNATIAIEDQNFYKHAGISITGTLRALINNLSGGNVQGGSTLTQQLVKQVFFSDQTSDRGLGGIPRKIKELILSIEVERMYNKDQILTLYLNESPYGGRRNGAESGAQSYFGKSAKDLNIAEAAMLAAIPQSPSLYNPYNSFGNDYLISRQHKVIDNMKDLKMISKEEAESAKKVPILDQLKPIASQYAGVKAPHFIQMVKSELETKLGNSAVGKGGLKITTTLDLRIQDKLNAAFDEMFSSSVPVYAGFTNGSSVVEDVKTGQIVALKGSRDFSYEGFGQDNVTTAFIQPGSTIKPLVYTQLFAQKPAGSLNYGSGTILKDENIDSLYGGQLNNYDNKFMGDIPIRIGLAGSRNIPAVKAMYISGIQNTISTIREMGGNSYCTQGVDTQVGLAAAIGGCGIKQTDLVNAYSTIARNGIWMDQSTVIQVKNSINETLLQWEPKTKKIVDPQTTYIVSDILHDPDARSSLTSRTQKGLYIPDVPTATKTGTTDLGGRPKDIWMNSYSPVLAMSVWFGNNNITTLRNGASSMPGPIIDSVMSFAHKEVYAKEGKWKINDWFAVPSGIQKIGKEVYPSWWSANQGQSNTQVVMDKFSKKKATQCTPENAKITIDAKKYIDPITKKDSFIAPDGYDANSEDDKHSCNDIMPKVSVAPLIKQGVDKYLISLNVTKGTFNISQVDIRVGDILVASLSAGNNYDYVYQLPSGKTGTIEVTAVVTDEAYYQSTSNIVVLQI